MTELEHVNVAGMVEHWRSEIAAVAEAERRVTETREELVYLQNRVRIGESQTDSLSDDFIFASTPVDQLKHFDTLRTAISGIQDEVAAHPNQLIVYANLANDSVYQYRVGVLDDVPNLGYELAEEVTNLGGYADYLMIPTSKFNARNPEHKRIHRIAEDSFGIPTSVLYKLVGISDASVGVDTSASLIVGTDAVKAWFEAQSRSGHFDSKAFYENCNILKFPVEIPSDVEAALEQRARHLGSRLIEHATHGFAGREQLFEVDLAEVGATGRTPEECIRIATEYVLSKLAERSDQ